MSLSTCARNAYGLSGHSLVSVLVESRVDEAEAREGANIPEMQTAELQNTEQPESQ